MSWSHYPNPNPKPQFWHERNESSNELRRVMRPRLLLLRGRVLAVHDWRRENFQWWSKSPISILESDPVCRAMHLRRPFSTNIQLEKGIATVQTFHSILCGTLPPQYDSVLPIILSELHRENAVCKPCPSSELGYVDATAEALHVSPYADR